MPCRRLPRPLATPVALLGIAAALASFATPAAALTAIFEAPGLTLGDDAVECADMGTYRICESNLGSERILSHDGQVPSERTPLDFHLLLPPLPTVGNDGLYPLVVFIHGWNGHRNSTGGFVEDEMIPYAESGYAVLAYSARGWGDSCGSLQQGNPECVYGWNHLADARYEVRDTQYIAGLLADELSDDGTPLIDPQRIGVTGVSYGGGQSTMLASLRNRTVDVDDSVIPWTSPAGKPMQIAAAAPYWPWTDLAYSLVPNGRNLDYVSNNSYFGPFDDRAFGVMKTSYVSGLYGTGQTNSNYAPPNEDPPLDLWFQIIDSGEPYTDVEARPIVEAVSGFRSGYYWIDPVIEPAPILFNSGWSDDLFPVDEPLRYLHRARSLHPTMPIGVIASDYGHARAASVDGAFARAAARAWFDHHLMGIGPLPGPEIRAKLQDCNGSGSPVISGPSWRQLSAGEVRLGDAAGGAVLSSSSPGPQATQAFDPISGGNRCSRVPDAGIAGGLVYDFPPPDAGGYTILGSPTVIADITVTGSLPEYAILVGRLLDIAPDGSELLLARGAYRPDATGRQVFQLHPMGAHVPDDHHLQFEFVGHEAPTHRQSNFSYTVTLADVELRVPVVEAPNGGEILEPAFEEIPPGMELFELPPALPALPGAGLAALAAGLLAAGQRARRATSSE